MNLSIERLLNVTTLVPAWPVGTVVYIMSLKEFYTLQIVPDGTRPISDLLTAGELVQLLEETKPEIIEPWTPGTALNQGSTVNHMGLDYLVPVDYTSGASVGADIVSHNLIPLGVVRASEYVTATHYSGNELVLDTGNNVVYVVGSDFLSGTLLTDATYLRTPCRTQRDISKWLPTTAYSKGAMVFLNGYLYVATKAFTSGANIGLDIDASSLVHSQRYPQIIVDVANPTTALGRLILSTLVIEATTGHIYTVSVVELDSTDTVTTALAYDPPRLILVG